MEDIAQILRNARTALLNAKQGLNILNGVDYEQYPYGFHSVVVFGRSVTFILQKLKLKVDNFEIWYDPYREEMKNDPLMTRFKDIRNSIEKEGEDDVVSATHIKNLNTSVFTRLPAPPGCIGYFFGDKYGRSGFNIRLPDGSEDIIYFDIGKFNLETIIKIKNSPNSHLGVDVSNQSLHNLCKLYLDYLERLLDDATLKFLSN